MLTKSQQAKSQQDQILVALQTVPLDRIRLMKTLFLFWYRNGRPANGPFSFKPYLYGPCSFDLYTALDDMVKNGLIVQALHSISRWANYHLTEAGLKAITCVSLDSTHRGQIVEIAHWSATQSFQSLLKQVYTEAPDYATQSILLK